MKRKKIILISICSFLLLIIIFYSLSLLFFMPKKYNNINWSAYANSTEEKIDIKVTTFNIRYATVNENESSNNWSVRKNRALEHIKNLDSDILGLQEVQPMQLSFLKKNLPEYGIVEEAYDFRLIFFTEKLVILYKTSVFELIETQTMWLSDTPNKPSKFSESSKYRICTLAVLRHRETDKIFVASNTHLDHMSDIARGKQLEKLCEMTSNISIPIFVLGDFNMQSSSEAYAYFTKHYADSRLLADTVDTPEKEYTFHGFYDTTLSNPKIIDYCFVSSNIKVNTYKIDSEDINGKPYSDHYSVTVNLTL